MKSTLRLDSSVQYLKGVGLKRKKLFAKLGIFSIRDLIEYYPRGWEDRRVYRKIAEVKSGETVTLLCQVEATAQEQITPKLGLFKVALSDGSGIIYALWYKRLSRNYNVFGTLKRIVVPKTKIIVHGTVELFRGVKQINVTEYEILSGDIADLIHTNRIVPLYSLTEGLEMRFLRQLIKTVIDKYAILYPEILPADIQRKYGLMHITEAIKQIHFPDSFALKEQSRQRIAFNEFLLQQTVMAILQKNISTKVKRRTYKLHKHLLTPFKQSLEFEFTAAQKRVINQIFNDMLSSKSMNRLLLGDVGSGKTIVAICALLLAIENGYQTALMCPTEILAEQHYYTLRHLLNKLNIKIALLTGSQNASVKKTIINKVASGEVQILIGTHALIEQRVKFHNLSFVVIDEQHKFGVIQRQKLRAKSEDIDMLVMTATPIPRSLALTLYGDLDISIIDELPPGRQNILTKLSTEKAAYEFVKEEIKKGHQAYIVFPLVEESDTLELKAAIKEAENLSKEVFNKYKVGLLHGKLSSKGKEVTMRAFAEGKYDILITTTIIEVGIDVSNATVMVIEHAERFGLATLHQLRGRIGRGSSQSYCLLLANPQTPESQKRIEMILSTNDGFKIAEADLELRGPGEFLGTAQHGLPEFTIANLLTDRNILELAREYAHEVVNKDRYLTKLQNKILLHELLKKYHGKFDLLQAG